MNKASDNRKENPEATAGMDGAVLPAAPPLYGINPTRKEIHQRAYVVSHLLPLLDRLEAISPMLDIGCGRGAVLSTLSKYRQKGVYTGIDNNAESIAAARLNERSANTRYIHGNALTDLPREVFKTILLCDVMEHMRTEQILTEAWKRLVPAGILYVSFPPWSSPFGGHQQTCAIKLGKIPWIHLLGSKKALEKLTLSARNKEDVISARETRLSVKRFEQWVSELSGANILHKRKYFVRPELARYGLRKNRAPNWMPDAFITGVEYVIRRD